MTKQRPLYLTYEYTIFILMLTDIHIFSQFLCWTKNINNNFWTLDEAGVPKHRPKCERNLTSNDFKSKI